MRNDSAMYSSVPVLWPLCGNLKRPLHWNLAHADHAVLGGGSRRWRLGGVSGLYPSPASSQYFSAAALRIFDSAHCGGVEKDGGDPQRTCLSAVALDASKAFPKAGEYLFEREATLPQVYE